MSSIVLADVIIVDFVHVLHVFHLLQILLHRFLRKILLRVSQPISPYHVLISNVGSGELVAKGYPAWFAIMWPPEELDFTTSRTHPLD